MMVDTDSKSDSQSHLLPNLLHFGRLLRETGFQISTQQVYELAHALSYIDIASRDDFYFSSRAFFVRNPDQIELFDRAFELFWLGQQKWMLLFGASRHLRKNESERIIASTDGLAHTAPFDLRDEDQKDISEPRFAATCSDLEILRHRDFADLTEAELDAARKFIKQLACQLHARRTRRKVRTHKPDAYLDLRRTIRRGVQTGEIMKLAWQRRKLKPRPLVVICDVSGSMEKYARMLLHFLYALVQGSRRVEAFVFGTRLTRITPALRCRDADSAVSQASELVMDWAGGTRIGESIRCFNYQWGRRVLGGGAVVLIISDGWDRGNIDLLEHEIDRLHRAASRLIWLNPLLGVPDYQPLAKGICAILPHVDAFLPFHDLASAEQLADALGDWGNRTKTR